MKSWREKQSSSISISVFSLVGYCVFLFFHLTRMRLLEEG
jgi:hypothetical protein